MNNREEFEHWARCRGLEVHRHGQSRVPGGDGDYHRDNTHLAWNAWNAGRATKTFKKGDVSVGASRNRFREDLYSVMPI